MKKTYNLLLTLFLLLFMASCQGEQDVLEAGGTGYLRLTVSGSAPTTKAANLPAGYTGKQIAVEIVNEEGKTVKSTNDWEEWEGEQIALPAGKYTIKAHSYGFDGKQSAMAAPYYYGSDEITIEKGKEVNRTIVCKLANVKMSVKIADDIKENFKSFGVSVKAKDGKSCDPIAFNIDLSATAIKDTAYFPVTDLVVSYSGQGKEGGSGSAEYELEEVAANDHYILNFTLQGEGQGDVTVEVDPTMHTYEYTFKVSQHPFNGASLTANPWAKLAYLSASNVTASSGATLSNLKLQYRQVGTEDWTDLETTSTGEGKDAVYTAMATSLTANTTYEYRLVGDNEFSTTSMQFTTEEEVVLQNGGFADWSTIQIEGIFGNSVNTAYPNASASVSFWDTSNKGANAMSTQDPTKSVTSPVIEGSKDNMAAMLQSKKVVIAFAAASLYTGTFGAANTSTKSATVNFGQPFSSRPIALHGYYQYTPVKIDNVDNDRLQAAGLSVKEGDMDECAIYVALTTDVITVDNSDVKKLFDPNDNRVIAYGALPSGAQTNSESNNGYVEFNIPLKYKSLTEKPTHIIIVCSSSKYGDYMTGGAGSTLYVDDFSLIYDGEPLIWE